ncbi:hypothetical protein [Bernardetia sp.]|uniref:hypothetical protein n=1 Tax=Bernardetia sp. TaxID=1937974 RepID=UPI0025B95205|nr:hypothetical protein [Bernardetia sp.]
MKSKRLNVQEQNNKTKSRILSEAKYWRKNGIPQGLEYFLREKNIDSNTSIFLEYEQDYEGISTDEGIIVTTENKFIRFSMDLNSDKTELIFLDRWEDITQRYEISAHKRGSGKTYGFLTLEVLQELNQV